MSDETQPETQARSDAKLTLAPPPAESNVGHAEEVVDEVERMVKAGFRKVRGAWRR